MRNEKENKPARNIQPLESGILAVDINSGYLYKALGFYKRGEDMPKILDDYFFAQLFGENDYSILYIGENSWSKVAGQSLIVEMVKQSPAYKNAMKNGKRFDPSWN